VALEVTVGLQTPAVSSGLRWTQEREVRSLTLIPFDFGDFVLAPRLRSGDSGWAQWVGWAAAIAALLGLLGVLARVLLQLARRRRSPTTVPLGSDAAPLVAHADARVLTSGLVAALETLATERNPSDAVVRAWQGLEDAAAAAGLARRPSETASEFTARILYRSQRSAEPIATLLALYHRVRFGEHVPSAQDITDAQASLTVLTELWRADLPERRLPRGPR
jgi:hypothetical protein